MTSETPSELAASEMPISDVGDDSVPEARMASFPPYPPYSTEPSPPSVADAIIAGRDLRLQHKSVVRKSVRPLPMPAKPRGPKVTDVKMSRRATRAHARCLRKHGAILTDRLERISKPLRRTIIYMWRDHANRLPPDTISRLRSMLDADEPFKPDQAYEYFVNLKKTRKKMTTTARVNEIKKDILAMCGEKRFMWARNATVAFARGIQQRLSRPGRYALADGMLRLSNIIMDDICCYMHMRPPSRLSMNPKAKFMMEISDKVAVWIDEILSESDDRMLMMDFDEDEDILNPDIRGDDNFTDDFLDMMGDGSGGRGFLLGQLPAHLKFTGNMMKAFEILTDSMDKKGDENLVSHGRFNQTFHEGADELRHAPDLGATEYSTKVADVISDELTAATADVTPAEVAPSMKDMVEICSNFLAQNAEYNKKKGPVFKELIKALRAKNNDKLFQKDKIHRSNGQAATKLEEAKGLETDHDDPNLTKVIHLALKKIVEEVTPHELKKEMSEIVNDCSKYLSENAVDEIERGPAFDLMIKELKRLGAEPFSKYPALGTKYAAGYTLLAAPGLSSVPPDPSTAPEFKKALHKTVDTITPKRMQQDMNDVIDRCGNYLSAFIRARGAAMKALIKMMESNPTNVFATRKNYNMDYKTGVEEIENAPTIVPFLPIKDIADEGKENLTRDMKDVTPPELTIPMKVLVQDVANHLSQNVAMRSGAAGYRYATNLLAEVMQTLGTRPLFKYKDFGQTYSDASDTLKHAGPIESHENLGALPTKSTTNLKHEINSEINKSIPSRLAPTMAEELEDTIAKAATHLAKNGFGKGNALEHLTKLMDEKGDDNLGQLQGYKQTYHDGARRIQDSPSLHNDKVDKEAYESVKNKLNTLAAEKPIKQHEEYMTGVVEDSAKFLAAPLPETAAEKRRVLADLMAREDNILAEDGIYKMSYKEGGEDIINAAVGVTIAKSRKPTKDMLKNIQSVIPDQRMMNLLKASTKEGAAHLTDVVKGRGQAMAVIHESLKKEKDKEFIEVGAFNKTHENVADMLAEAPNFSSKKPSPVIMENVAYKISKLVKDVPPEMTMSKDHMEDASNITAKYIARQATKQSGLDAEQLAALDAAGFNAEARVAAEDTGVGGAAAAIKGAGVGAAAAAQTGAGVGAAAAAQMGAGVGDARYDPGSETEEERRKRLAEEAERRRLGDAEYLSQQAKKRRLALEAQGEESGGPPVSQMPGPNSGPSPGLVHIPTYNAGGIDGAHKYLGGALGAGYDPEHEAALEILLGQLRSHGTTVFYQQPQTSLNHAQASNWLSTTPMKVDKTVKESGDTARLHKKFERKLSALVATVTPPELYDSMQDVVIESSRLLSEFFVATNYKALVRDALISEMQKRGNEILIELDGAAVTSFSAAQRLKKRNTEDTIDPCYQIAHQLSKKLEEITRCRPMPRKLTATMKDHIKDAAGYLSEAVSIPDEHIEAYIALLCEMEAGGDMKLVNGNIPKSYKEAAAYLRQLTSFEDQIGRPDRKLQSEIGSNLKELMSDVPPNGYTTAIMGTVIAQTVPLLVSYIMLQDAKTKALNILLEEMSIAGESVLLRHGPIRKSYKEGADSLQGKTSDQLSVSSADPVVARKIQIKLNNLMLDIIPDYKGLMEDVIEDATMYLAVHFLQPQPVIKVCKCRKNVCVQCELWCDEILRRMNRPSCTCSRHVSAQVLQELEPAQRLDVKPHTRDFSIAGHNISFTSCPSILKQQQNRLRQGRSPECRANNPTPDCPQKPKSSYLMYSSSCKIFGNDPTRLSPSSGSSYSRSRSPSPPLIAIQPRSSIFKSLLDDIHSDNKRYFKQQQNILQSFETKVPSETTPSFSASATTYLSGMTLGKKSSCPFLQNTTALSANVQMADSSAKITQAKTGYSSRTPIVSTDQMGDWHAMMVSLMWNVHAWRDWIQEIVDRALAYQHNPNVIREQTADNWLTFNRRVSTEALQWRQYSMFSRQLTTRLILRYRDKEIVSPKRATIKTKTYLRCQEEMMDIIDMFNRWTRWLTLVVKETDSLHLTTGSDLPLHELRWTHLKKKVNEHYPDWVKYNMYLKVFWEQRYSALILDFLPSLEEPGPFWVVSACGAVPSGAVAAGVYDAEVIWIARTTHRGKVLPAALYPSKHCCFVYAAGAVRRYTKYQVMCNSSVRWVPWRGGSVGARALRVAPGVHVGRVHYRGNHLLGAVLEPHYRCHVVIFGRPFAFNCYELLMLAGDDKQ